MIFKSSSVLLLAVIGVIFASFSTAAVSSRCMCTLNYEPVCGSDGTTYGNLCQLNCVQKSGVTLVHNGECVQNICSCTKELMPVCGSNGQTYPNICLFKCAKKAYPDLTVTKNGNC